MPDDTTNDRLMEKFIESATPKLLEALTGHVSEHVQKEISGLVANSKSLLEEVKQARAERDAIAEKSAADFTQLKTLLERGESPTAIKSALKPEPITLSRQQARDPAIYRRAKAQAQANGTSVAILDD